VVGNSKKLQPRGGESVVSSSFTISIQTPHRSLRCISFFFASNYSRVIVPSQKVGSEVWLHFWGDSPNHASSHKYELEVLRTNFNYSIGESFEN